MLQLDHVKIEAMAASSQQQVRAHAPLGEANNAACYGRYLKPPLYGVIRALLFRCAHIDAHNIMALHLFYTVSSIIVAVNFYDFQINSAIDARVFISIIGITIVLCRYIFVDRQLLLLQAEIRASELEMRQDVYGPLAFLSTSLLRSALLMWFLILPNIAMTYFVIGLADDDAALGVLFLTLGLMSLVMMNVVMHLFMYGLAHRHVVAIAYFLEFVETYISGVVVPINYIASWASWFRNISPSYRSLRAIALTMLQSRTDTCAAQDQLDGGVLGCFSRTANPGIAALDLSGRGGIAETDLIALLGLFFGVFVVSWLLLYGAQRHRLHHVAVDGEVWVKHLRRSLHNSSDALLRGAGKRNAGVRGAARGVSSAGAVFGKAPPVSRRNPPDGSLKHVQHTWPTPVATEAVSTLSAEESEDITFEMAPTAAQPQARPARWVSIL